VLRRAGHIERRRKTFAELLLLRRFAREWNHKHEHASGPPLTFS
jgi:hypothetical protein